MKAVVKFGYKRFVMPLDDAVRVLQHLSEAESYDTEYDKESKMELSYIGQGGHVMDIQLNLISDDDYAVAKMRGNKPNN